MEIYSEVDLREGLLRVVGKIPGIILGGKRKAVTK